jgi:hypothetical protein
MTPFTRDFKSNTEGHLSLSISSRTRNGESVSVWDQLVRPIPSVMGQVLIALGSLTHAALLESFTGSSRTFFASPASSARSRRGIRITLRQARELALRVMAEAERQTREERMQEVLFLRGPVDEES